MVEQSLIEQISWWITLAASAGFGIAAILALIRVVIGPTILDRMVASDVLVTTLMLVAGTSMVIYRHTNAIGLMILLAATSVLATIMVARYVRRRQDVSIPEVGEPHV